MASIQKGKTQKIGFESLFNGSPNYSSYKYGTVDYESKNFRYGIGGHYGYSSLERHTNVGGPMYLESIINHQSTTDARRYWRGGAANQFYDGCFLANGAGRTIPTNINVDDFGALAYFRMKPTKPSMNGLNSIYELKDLPGMLKQRMHSSGLKNIGSYYLALKFGWESLAGDLLKLYKTQQSLEKRINWLLKHNGKPVRTNVVLRDEMSDPVITSGTAYGSFSPVLVTQYYASQPTWRQTDYTKDRIWAAARFRYWLPGGAGTVAWTRRIKAELLGLRPSPSVIWRGYPWSWLSDWFFNTGLVLSNLESGVADKCAADYFYIMRTIENVREYFAQGTFHSQHSGNFQTSATLHSSASVKMRAVGDPFGFNTNPSGLDSGKLAILGALGLSKL